MFFAAIPSPPFLFARKFAGPKFATLKFVRPFVKISAQRFVLRLATTFIPKFAKTSSQLFVRTIIQTLEKMSAQHFALMAG